MIEPKDVIGLLAEGNHLDPFPRLDNWPLVHFHCFFPLIIFVLRWLIIVACTVHPVVSFRHKIEITKSWFLCRICRINKFVYDSNWSILPGLDLRDIALCDSRLAHRNRRRKKQRGSFTSSLINFSPSNHVSLFFIIRLVEISIRVVFVVKNGG